MLDMHNFGLGLGSNIICFRWLPVGACFAQQISALRQRPDCRSGSRPVHLPDADELHAAGPIPPSAPPCEAVGPVPVASRPSLPLRGSFWRVARIPPTAPSPIPFVVKRIRLLLGSQGEGTALSRPRSMAVGEIDGGQWPPAMIANRYARRPWPRGGLRLKSMMQWRPRACWHM